MADREVAYYEEADSSETLDLYELLLEDGASVDFWFPKGRQPAPMDLSVVFERGALALKKEQPDGTDDIG